MEITATLIGAGNYPISVPPGTGQDLGSHPRVHFRERGTGFHFFKQSLSSFVHVFLSFAFFSSSSKKFPGLDKETTNSSCRRL